MNNDGENPKLRVLPGEEGRNRQFDSEYQPNPPGWEGMVSDLLDLEILSVEQLANVLCHLAPGRRNFAVDPNGSNNKDEFGFNRFTDSTDPYLSWELDATERKYWWTVRRIHLAIEMGELRKHIVSSPLPRYPATKEELEIRENNMKHFGFDSYPEPSFHEGINPQEGITWAVVKKIPDIPELLLEYADLDTPENEEDPKETIRRLRQKLNNLEKREKQLVAVASLLISDPNKVAKKGKISLEQISNVMKKIHQDDPRVLEVSVVPSKKWLERHFTKVRDRISEYLEA